MNITCIIPTKGNSRRVPNKNIRILGGKPLIEYTLIEIQKSIYINKTYVSTDSKNIIDCASQYPVEIIKRPRCLCKPEVTTEEVIIHALDKIELPDYVVVLYATSPFRKCYHIDALIEKVLKNGADSGQSISELKQRTGSYDGVHYTYDFRSSEYDMTKLEPIYVENSGIYVLKPELLIDGMVMYGKKHVGYVMKEPYDLDINTWIDWATAFVIKYKEWAE